MVGRALCLHVGLPKTASTWLQERVFPALAGLTVRSMPRTRLFASPQDQASGCRTFDCALRRSAALWPVMGDALLAEMLGPDVMNDAGPVLLSEEAIGRAASRPESLAAHMRGFGDAAARAGFVRPRLLAMVRRQDHWLASHYAQISDRRRRPSQRDFESMVAATLDPARDRMGFGMLLDYGRLHATLTEVAGEEGVLILPYEALATEPEATLARMAAWLGSPAALAGPIASSDRANVRTLSDGDEPAWRLRPPLLSLGRGRRANVPGALWPRRRIVLGRDLSDAILDAYAPSNARLAQATGLDLERFGYVRTAAPG